MKFIPLLFVCLPGFASAAESPGSETKADSIPFSEIGSKATAAYKGNAIGIHAVAGGAELHTGFQKLSGTVTDEGLWLKSTETDGGGLHLVADSIGRQTPDSPHSPLTPQLLRRGSVTVGEKRVTFARPGITEEYSVSADGVRQDFIVAGRPAGAGQLRVELALTGARAESAVGGAKLILEGSGRELAYSRLLVTDASGRGLPAELVVVSPDRLAVRVDDLSAVYPVRIDPTFSDADWVSMNPGVPGTDGSVSTMIVDGGGNLYIGGDFSVIGSVPANNIAKWNGSSWSPLGLGTDSAVRSLEVSGTDLYAGGEFITAGGVSVSRIARWNGSAWSALGTGMDDDVYAVTVIGTDIYAGGFFKTAGGVAANRIAKWNGSTWSPLGTGANRVVMALAAVGNDLYMGGRFTSVGGGPANYIAKWNGSVWSAIGSGMDDEVSALAVIGTDLYAGGYFTTAGGVTANCVAKWNGSSWSGLGSGMDSPDSVVYRLAVSGTDLYAGGYFATAGGVTAGNIAKWNGSSWSAFGSGVNSEVTAMAVLGGDLYAGGDFTSAGGVLTNYVAKWNGSSWSALGTGMNHSVSALLSTGTDLYVGGEFTTVGGVAANRVAKWNGSAWSALGSGIGGPYPVVEALAVIGTDLYAGGNFSTAGGASVNGIAKWNGSAWSALGTVAGEPMAFVHALAVIGTDLYAGGQFSTVGGVEANNVAKWNGSVWSPLAQGIGDSGSNVHALAAIGTDLYAGGQIELRSNGVLVSGSNGILKWNGSAWSTVGSGVSGYVLALAPSGTDLFVGGAFATASGVPANNVAKWNGSGWAALGSGITTDSEIIYPEVRGLAVIGTDLYAGGHFTIAGEAPANNIAKWSGSAWSALGTGLNNRVNTLAVINTDLYLGGYFTIAGTAVSPYLVQANLGGIPPATGYSVWASSKFSAEQLADSLISGAGADPDKDGLVNLLECAFNTLPLAAGHSILTAGTGTIGLPLITTIGSGATTRLRFEYVRRKTGFIYSPEVSDALSNAGWNAPAGTPGVISIDADWERVVVEDTAGTGQPKRFGRVRVISTP